MARSMQRHIARQHQRGSVLIIGLILMAAATVLTLMSVQSSIMQERMTANSYNKEAARLAAEAGAIRVMEWVSELTPDDWNDWRDGNTQPWHSNPNSAMNNNPNSAMNSKKGIPASPNAAPFMNNNSLFWIDPNDLDFSNPAFAVVRVNGGVKQPTNDDEADAPLQAVATITLRVSPPQANPGSGLNPFGNGLVGCDGVIMSGSGKVDSFDSDLAGYGHVLPDDGSGISQFNSDRTNVTVSTITAGATATMTGGAPIYGNLAVTGDLNMSGSPHIYGNVHADGNVAAQWGGMGGTIEGNLTAVGGVNIGNNGTVGSVQSGGVVTVAGTVNGNLTAAGSIDFTNSSNSTGIGAVQSGGNVTMDWNNDPSPTNITAAGSIARQAGNLPTYIQNANIPPITVAPILDPTDVCDNIGLVDQNGNLGQRFTDALNHPDLVQLNNYPFPAGYGISAGGTLTGPGTDGNNLTLGATGTDTLLNLDGNFGVAGDLAGITIEGNVTLVVDGSFNLGDNTQLTIADNATLTLLVTGTTTFSAGTNLTTNGGSFVRGEGDSATPAVQIFSAVNQDNLSWQSGVTIAGNNDTHVAVYAPYATVNVTAGGNIFGAVRARTLDISGGAGIHFDEALARVTDGGGSGDGQPTPASVNSWFETIN